MKTSLSLPMRTLYGLLLLTAGLWSSCDDASSKLPDKPEMKVSNEPLLFSADGGEQIITFTTNRAWQAMLIDNLDDQQQPWCSLSAEEGEAGSQQLVLRTERLEGDYRQATLLLNASAAGCEIAVMQSGQPVLTTDDAVQIDESGATLGGSWIYSGPIDAAEFGIAVRKPDQTQPAYYPVSEREANGAFSTRVTELESTTRYRFTAYLLTSDGTLYQGAEKEFTTDAAPVRTSVAELKAAGRQIVAGGQQTLTASQYVEGIVIASYRPATEPTPEAQAFAPEQACIMLVDGTEANSGITLRFDQSSQNTYRVGDKLSVRTKDGVLRHAQSGLVDILPLPAGIRVLSTGNEVAPTTIDHTNLADYESMAVRIERTQLTRLFTDQTVYPTWGSATLWNMEVEQSETSYLLHVPADCELAAQTPRSGSGPVSGIVVRGDDDYALRCDKTSDVAGLVNERFESLLELRFLAPEFQGSLCAGEAATGNLAIPYRNGDNSVLAGQIWAEITGGEAVTGDLAVTPVSDWQIGTGSGSILLAVTGTPGAAGTVTFTVHGLEALGTQNTCTAEVIVPDLPEVGNFEAVWDTNTEKGAARTPGSSSNSSISITDMTLTASAANISGTKWADFAAIGWDTNTAANKLSAPVQYFQTTLTVGSGKTLALSGMDIEQRINGGDVTLSVQYALNGGAFVEIEALPLTSDSQPFTVNLGKTAALNSLAEGTRITLRLVPMTTSATIKWGIKKGSRLAVYGNAE